MTKQNSASSNRTTYFFSAGDVLMFQVSGGRFGAVVCVQIGQQKGPRTYDLVATTFMDTRPPTMKDIYSSALAGVRIESGFNAATTLLKQPGVDEIWRHERQENFFFGLPYMLVAFKDMKTFVDRFQIIGKLEIKTPFVRQGGYSYFSTFEKVEKVFLDLEGHMKAFRQIKVPVSILCQ